MQVKFKALDPLAFLPSYAKEGDAGLDVYSIDNGTINRIHDFIEYKTGLACEIPPGFVGLLFPRSSVSNYSLVLCNSVGVLDSGFRGEIKVRFKGLGDGETNRYRRHDRIGQLLILPYPKIIPCWSEILTESTRGEDGYGSTGA